MRTVYLCYDHAVALWEEWVAVAVDEAEFARAYNSWIDRIENEREDLYYG
jgi:hypothetical protein